MSSLPQFNVADIAITVLLLLGLVRGAKKGLSGELSGLISIGAALFAGWKLHEPIGDFIIGHTRLSGAAAYVTAFVATLVGGYLVMKAVRLISRHVMEFSFKGRIERIGGALAGLTKTAAVVAAVVLAIGLSPSAPFHGWVAKESVIGRTLCRTLTPVYEDLSEKYPALKIPRKGEEEPIEDEEDAATGEPAEETPERDE